MTATTNRTTARKVYEGKGKDRSRRTRYLISTAIIVLVIAAIIATIAFTPMLQDMFTRDGESTEQTILATVNGEHITQEEFDRQWNTLPPTVKLQVGKEALLEDLINQELLLQNASEKGISTSERETEAFISQQLAMSGSSVQEFKQQLEGQGITYDDVIQTYQKQLTIARLFEELPGTDLNVSDERIEEFYEENKEQFHQDERVTVQHILIEVNNESNETESQALAQELDKQLEEKNNSNFCGLVENYTMDLGSRDNCGEYTFSRGRMDKSFENASFEMEVGEREIVRSDFGYHIILKTKESEPGYLGINDTIPGAQGQNTTVRENIKNQITQEKTREVYDEYVTVLREQATITTTDKLSDNMTSEENTPELEENITMDLTPSENETE